MDSNSPNIPPPSGNPIQAEKYINQLIGLIESDKLSVYSTDLSKFNPSSMQDHYLLELSQYQVEISHSKHPNSSKDSFIILFTNIKKVSETFHQKLILAFMHLDENQFMRFKKAALEQRERKRREEEERRLKEAMKPLDQVLDQLSENNNSMREFKAALS